MKELIAEINEKVFVEIPHQGTPTCSILSESELKNAICQGWYGENFERWAVNNDYCKPAPDFELPDGDSNPEFAKWERELYGNQDALIGYMGHDLHALHVFDSAVEAMEWGKTYKGHQWVKVTVMLEKLLEIN